jgi:nucleotide-binding universal stress UspA family protein
MAHATSVRSTSPAAREGGAHPDTGLVSLKRILVALDASDYANRALAEAARLAASADGVVTGIHAYAARMHDRRFRQMEGGLPERYRQEDELGRQREVHDDLITCGLGIISDSYHDAVRPVCEAAAVPYRALSPEGKNYRRIVEATQSGDFDVLVLGALGLGAVPGSTVGTVCERVVRRSAIEVLVIRDPDRGLSDGPIVAAVDGSPQSFGALKTALDLGRRLGARVHAVAAYDPYFHYVAFHKIAAVLSDEAARVFRFKEQEKLHEDIIDSGLAKIYQSHLEIARQVAVDEAEEIECKLLDGKPYRAIARYLEEVGASLVVLGKIGIHADAGLDIGGNAENLLRMAPCHVWLGQATFTPPLEAVAKETISWSAEAEAAMDRVPEGPRAMIRMAILRYAHERGHTVITSDLIDETTERFCPARGAAAPDAAVGWSAGAQALLGGVGDAAMAASIRLRAEKRARREDARTVTAEHVRPFLDDQVAPALTWTAAALARLARVPEMVRETVRGRVEASARERGVTEITLEVAEAGLARAKRALEEAMASGMDPGSADRLQASSGEKKGSACPFADLHGTQEGEAEKESSEPAPFEWTPKAEERMGKIPPGFIRTMTRQRIEVFARRQGARTITPALVDEKYAEWAAGSAKQKMNLKWRKTALARIDRIPEFVRGMVILEVEHCARKMGKDTVTEDVIDKANGIWEKSGAFHLDANPNLYKSPQRRRARRSRHRRGASGDG